MTDQTEQTEIEKIRAATERMLEPRYSYHPDLQPPPPPSPPKGEPMKVAQKAALAVAFVLLYALPVLAQATPTPTVTVSTGTLAGEALTWLAAVFGVPVATLLAAWLYRLFALVGVQTTDLMRQRLQEMIVNGLNGATARAEQRLRGRGTIEIKNEAVAETVQYVQKHGADTLTYLGVDPASNKAVDAIKARIEAAIADANTPTPPVLGGPTPAKPIPATPPLATQGATR